MKNLFARLASACLLVLLSYATAAAQADQWVPGAGGRGGNDFQARCPIGQHLVGFNLRAGHNIDAIQPICGVPTSETQVQVSGQMRGYGGMGGSPAQVTCLAAAGTPVVLGLGLRAEGIDGKVLNDISLYCGIVAAQQRIPAQPAAEYHAPMQEDTYGALASGSEVGYAKGQPMCTPGLIGVGVYGRSGAAVDWLGLICGAAQTGFTSGRTLNKRKLPKDETAGRTLNKRKLPKGETAGRTLNKRKRPAETSSAAVQGALAAARASVNPAIYDQYVGRYLVSSPANYYAINREGNRLYLVRPDNKLELIPQSETDFLLHSTEITIRFNKNREGRVVSLQVMSPVDNYAPTYWREGHQPWPKNPF